MHVCIVALTRLFALNIKFKNLTTGIFVSFTFIKITMKGSKMWFTTACEVVHLVDVML